MNQCLSITLMAGVTKGFLDSLAKRNVAALGLEGVAQLVNDSTVKIVVCGESNCVDEFIDFLYEGSEKYQINDILIESFFKERDYRGIFRVII